MTEEDPLDFEELERLAAERSLHLVFGPWDGPPAEPRGGDADEGARWAALRALRIDLALIVDDPSLLFPCLYNRARWFDDPAAEGFYEARYGLEAPSGQAPGALGERLERWRARRRARGEARPWARSLRPPQYRLGGALLEEYRGAFGGPVAFSDDGEEIVVRGEPTLGWHRRTGQRLGPERLASWPQAAPPRWKLERADFGSCRLIGPEGTFALTVDDDSSLDALAELPGGEGLVIGGWFDDYAGVVFRVDPPYTKVSWRAEVGSAIQGLTATAGGKILASDGKRIVVLDAATGRQTARVPSSGHGAAIDPRGKVLATAGRDLIQVWSLDALALGEPPRMSACEQGWNDAAFSPDGRRLLTGEMLCDAESGRLIGRLDLDGPGYLEGGPPERGRRLANGRYVEMAPMRGVQVFETERGERAVRDPERRHSIHRDAIEISPDGLTYVRHGSRGSSEAGAELRRTDDGLPLAHLATAAPAVARFSRDGSLLFLGAHDGAGSLWSVPAGRLVARMDAHGARVNDALFSHDGALLITAGDDDTVRLWTSSGERVAEHTRTKKQAHLSLDDLLARLARLDKWRDFALPPGRYAFRRRGGLGELVDPRTGAVAARVVTEHELIGDGGLRWAYRSVHVALEEEA